MMISKLLAWLEKNFKQILGGISLSRRLARETALQVLFQRDLTQEPLNIAETVQSVGQENL